MSNTRDNYYEVFNVFTPIMVGIAILVWTLILFMVLRYRRPEGGRSTSRTEAPVPESLYVVGLTGLAAFLVYLTFSTMDEETDPGPKPPPSAAQTPERVDITAARWNWRFDYPRHGITQVDVIDRPATLVVPADTPIDFEQRTKDVIHSFFVPPLRFKADAFPGQVNRFRLVFPDVGHFRAGEGGQCAQYCGLRHSYMRFEIDVLEPAAYRRWVARRSGEGTPG